MKDVVQFAGSNNLESNVEGLDTTVITMFIPNVIDKYFITAFKMNIENLCDSVS